MIGTIIGDTVGSRFEGKINIPAGFELLTEESRFTDDTVHTLAIAKALKEHQETGESLNSLAVKYLQEFGRRYIWCGCGDKFYEWLFKFEPEPYNSYANGAAMRVSPCAWYASSLEQALEYAEIVTSVTHNHPEAVQGAKAVTEAIWLIRNGVSDKNEVRQTLISDGLYLPQEVIPNKFDVTCRGTVNAAITAFMNGSSYTEVIRNAIMYGGDTDTNAAIAGSLAEAAYGVPADLANEVLERLDDFLMEIFVEVEKTRKME